VILLYLFNKDKTAILLSRRARCCPMQFLFPELKGKKLNGSVLDGSLILHLSGLNYSGLEKNYCLK
jgi:hypothetical protein